jgi:hypothetical protein
MRTDRFDLSVTVASGTGSIGWSDLVSNWIIDSVEVIPPSAGTYDLRVNTQRGSGVLSETGLSGNTTAPCGRNPKGPLTITIENATADGIYTVSINTKG